MTPSPPPAQADMQGPKDPKTDQDDLFEDLPREPTTIPGAIPEYSYDLKIPKDRIAVLIGPAGATKKELEEQTRTRVNVDSKEGDVSLRGKDSLALFSLREVVMAIGRGFNPEIAQLLLKQDYTIEIIPITEYSRQKTHIARMRGRVIGAEGKSRVTIERLTETFIVVYGKTISIIGTTERCQLARRAIESLLEGSNHSSVYKWLEKAAKALRKKEGFSF